MHLNRKRADINKVQGQQKHSGTVQDPLISSTQETECLPEEDVSITEDISHDDQIENMKALINGNSRRKLYFNPAYFEPHLLAVSKRLQSPNSFKSSFFSNQNI